MPDHDQPSPGLSSIVHKIRLYVALFLGGLIAIFALQNVGKVDLSFVFWTFQSRLIVVIIVSLVIGLIIGWFYGHGGGGGRHQRSGRDID
ncbi:MAG TPA: lipopolysaccharide assembly protein LapA domain-containing protein [Afifellaceae bacterium]|nr:lipopolysaccharide assembly protein LapA domain-containing protein [Afifellaceae bacterium]